MNDRRPRGRAPIHRVGRMAEEHRRRSGVDRTEAEREPARTMHLAWFGGSQDVGAGMFASAVRFVKWNEVRLPSARSTFRRPRVSTSTRSSCPLLMWPYVAIFDSW